MTYVLGLTGSIGMGKSTTANLFRKLGVPVWDADAVVHKLYSQDVQVAESLESHVQGVTVNGKVDRQILREAVKERPDLLPKIEALIHPLVAADRNNFIKAANAPLVVCDIPLLFETSADDWLDGVLVVSAPPSIQRARVLARDNMSEDLFELILSKQVPDAEKRARADYVIETISLTETEAAVKTLIDKLKANHA